MRRNRNKILAHKAVVTKKRVSSQNIVSSTRIASFFDTDRICIYAKNGGVGDILMLTAPLKKLRDKYPNSYIELAIHTNGANDNIFNLIDPIGIVNKVSNFRYIRKGKFGTFVDVSVVAEPAWEINRVGLRSRIDYYSSLLQVDSGEKIPYLNLSSLEKNWAKSFLKSYGRVFFLDTSSIDNRRCIPSYIFVELIKLINERYSNHIILISDWQNRDKKTWGKYPNVIEVSNSSLREVASLINRSDVFFGPDSGLMHLSAAVKTKSLVAFGMIPPEFRISTYSTHEAIRVESLSCLGCWYKPCHNDLKCMRSLDPLLIFKRITKMIGG